MENGGTSPKFLSGTSKGSLKKLFKDGKMYKFNCQGYEDIAEALVSELESFIDGFSYVDYYLDVYNGSPCCYSYNFRRDNLIETTFYRLLSSYKRYKEGYKKYKGVDYLKFIEDCIYEMTEINVHQYLSNCIKLDSIVLNEDRHLNNLTLWNSLEDGSYSTMPIFDNGLSLLSCLKIYPMMLSLDVLLTMPEAHPFSKKFSTQVKMFSDTPPLVIDIEGLRNSLELNKPDLKAYLGRRFKYYLRAEKVLLRQLKLQEGITWIRSS